MTARVLCPHVAGMLRLETSAALDLYATGWQAAELAADDDFAYWRLLRDEWAKPGDLVIVEQDVVVAAGTLPGFAACRRPVCSAVYDTGEPGFGCSRIRGEVKTMHLDLFDAVGPTTWKRRATLGYVRPEKRKVKPHDRSAIYSQQPIRGSQIACAEDAGTSRV
jgi:hypothetical protein